MITTEALFTGRDGFRITTATPSQRAACRIVDGLPLGNLSSYDDVRSLVGGREALALLPKERPTEIVFLAAIRSAKTILACAACLRMALTVDVRGLGPGETPRASLVSLRLDASAVAYRLLVETVRASRILRPLIMGEPTADTLTLRHPSGRPIEVATVAGAKAGGTLVARWCAGVVFDEAPRMASAEDAAVNLSHQRDAVAGRLLEGAQILEIGSPHGPFGEVYNLVQEHWQKPTRHLVVLRGTGPMLNPTWWTPERCERLRTTNPTAYATDVLGEFADPEMGLLSPATVRRNMREDPLELPFSSECIYAAAVDLAEGTARGNAVSLVIVERSRPQHPARGRTRATPELEPAGPQALTTYRVTLAREWRGLGPGAYWDAIASACSRYGVETVHGDQYAASANVELARRVGLNLEIERTTAATKLDDATNLATILHADRLELAPCRQLQRDVLSIRRRATQQGYTIVLPRTSDGRHADLAPALWTALKHCTPSEWDTWRESRGGRLSFHIPGI